MGKEEIPRHVGRIHRRSQTKEGELQLVDRCEI